MLLDVEPVFHKKVVPVIELPTLIVADPPSQISVALLVKVNIGNGRTVIEVCPVDTHPSGLLTVSI